MRPLVYASIFLLILLVMLEANAKEAVGPAHGAHMSNRQSTNQSTRLRDSLRKLCGGMEAEHGDAKKFYDCVDWHNQVEDSNLRQLAERCGGVKALSADPPKHEACIEINRASWKERTERAQEVCGGFNAFLASTDKYRKCFRENVKQLEFVQPKECPSEISKLKASKFDPKKPHTNGMAMLVSQVSQNLEAYEGEFYVVDRLMSQPTVSFGRVCAALGRMESTRAMIGKMLGILADTVFLEQVSDFEPSNRELSDLTSTLCETSTPSQASIQAVQKKVDALSRGLGSYRKRICL